jgi:hypothetical protein
LIRLISKKKLLTTKKANGNSSKLMKFGVREVEKGKLENYAPEMYPK